MSSTVPVSLPPFFIKRHSASARLPTKGSVGAAGWDLYASTDGLVPARGQALVSTDISIAVPRGCYGRIAPRSGLALRNSIDVGAGVVDADFRSTVGIILFNHSDVEFSYKAGDRVAQLILEHIMEEAEIIEVPDLPPTQRGEGGFGSTGK